MFEKNAMNTYTERVRMREREIYAFAATLAHALCFVAFVDVFVNEKLKISL